MSATPIRPACVTQERLLELVEAQNAVRRERTRRDALRLSVRRDLEAGGCIEPGALDAWLETTEDGGGRRVRLKVS